MTSRLLAAAGLPVVVTPRASVHAPARRRCGPTGSTGNRFRGSSGVGQNIDNDGLRPARVPGHPAHPGPGRDAASCNRSNSRDNCAWMIEPPFPADRIQWLANPCRADWARTVFPGDARSSTGAGTRLSWCLVPVRNQTNDKAEADALQRRRTSAGQDPDVAQAVVIRVAVAQSVAQHADQRDVQILRFGAGSRKMSEQTLSAPLRH